MTKTKDTMFWPNMKVGIFEVDHCEPVAPAQEEQFHFHVNFFGRDVVTDNVEVQDRVETSAFFLL